MSISGSYVCKYITLSWFDPAEWLNSMGSHMIEITVCLKSDFVRSCVLQKPCSVMQIHYHLNSFILASGFAIETNVIPTDMSMHTHTHSWEIKQEWRRTQWNTFIDYSKGLVTAFHALSPLSGVIYSGFFSSIFTQKCSKYWETATWCSAGQLPHLGASGWYWLELASFDY